MFLMVGATIVLGLYMAWSIGANDVANSMGDAVGSGAIRVRHAIILAAVCEFAGALLVGAHVTDTVRKGIVSPESLAAAPEVLALGMACTLLAAAVWLHLATWMGMPVSTTHSIVGGVVGFGIIAAGWHSVRWGALAGIVASWAISPIAGGALAFLLFKVISRFILGSEHPARAAVRLAPVVVFLTVAIVVLATAYEGLKNVLSARAGWLTGRGALWVSAGAGLACAALARLFIGRFLRDKHHLPLAEQIRMVERVFAPLVVITSCSVAFAHGANDVANAVGPLAAVYDIVTSGTVKMQVLVPPWVLALGGAGIVLGLSTYGYRVMETVGKRITQLTPSRGVAADIAVAAAVLACSRLKLPVSTTHTLVGAILGIGMARGLGAVNRKVTRSIFGSWFVTVPASALLAVVFFLLGRAVLLDAMRHAMRSASGAG
jgi:PiT family inorganic phosphate transporter